MNLRQRFWKICDVGQVHCPHIWKMVAEASVNNDRFHLAKQEADTRALLYQMFVSCRGLQQ